MRIYHWLLGVLPRELRDEYRTDMAQLFRERLADTASWRARVVWCVGAVIDVLRVAVAARLAHRFGRTRRPVRPLGDLPMEVRLATRALLRAPTHTIAAVVTLAVGIGTATAFFSVVNGMLLRPLPFREADRLITVYSESMTDANFEAWRETRFVESVAAYTGNNGMAATDVGAATVRIRIVDGHFFDLLGVQAARGRLVQPADDRAEAAMVAVVSERFWQEHFAGSPLGRPLTIDGRTFEVVGTLPAHFAFSRADRTAVWVPFAHADVDRGGLVAKLRVGQSVEEATRAFQQFAERLPQPAGQRDSENAPVEVHVAGLHDGLFGETELRTLWILFGAAVLVLLLGAANVAALSVGRSVARRDELAVRTALGASRFRIVRQLVVEAGVLAVWACGGGLLFAQLTPALMALAPQYLSRREEVSIDSWVLLFALGAAAITVVILGVVPALAVSLRAERTSLHSASSHIQRSGRAQSALVVGEVAVALVLTIGALLLVQTYAAVRPTQPGFQVEDRVIAAFELPDHRYRFRDDEQSLRFADDVLANLRALPGAPRAELATNVPLTVNAVLATELMPAGDTAAAFRALFRSVSAGYLELMHMPVTLGRGFRNSDRAGSQLVAVLNETAARRLWNTTDVVGRRVRAADEKVIELEVVGVVRDAWYLYGPQTRPEVFVAFAQLPFNRFSIVIESTPARPVTARHVRDVVNRVDRGVPVLSFSTLREAIGWSAAPARFQATLLTLLTAIGIILAATGCFAVLLQNVGRRTRELGVRITLGATSRSVALSILRSALVLAVIGTVLGIGIATAATRLLESALFGVERTDPATFVGAALVVVLVIASAALVPARRVARLDPVQALRHL